MKSFQIAFLAAAALAAGPAAAFTIQTGNGPADVSSSRYADPDERLPQFASPRDRAPSTTRFGDSGVSVGLSGSRGEPEPDQSAAGIAAKIDPVSDMRVHFNLRLDLVEGVR